MEMQVFAIVGSESILVPCLFDKCWARAMNLAASLFPQLLSDSAHRLLIINKHIIHAQTNSFCVYIK